MKSLFVKLSSILVLILLFQSKAWGGSLNYEVFAITTYAPMLEAPCYNNYSYLSTCNNSSPTGVGVSQGTGTLSSLNYNWNSGQINFGGNTNYGSEQRMVVITGYWQHPGTTGQTSTVHFAGRNDDGLIVNINNTSVVSDWAHKVQHIGTLVVHFQVWVVNGIQYKLTGMSGVVLLTWIFIIELMAIMLLTLQVVG